MKLQNLLDPNFKHFSTQMNKVIRPSGNIVVYTSYVTIYTYKPKRFPHGTKVSVKVEQNYRAPFQYTIYFGLEGEEISRKEFYQINSI